MPTMSDASQKNISAQAHSPSRSSAVANASSGISSVRYTDVVVNEEGVSINHRVTEYIMTKAPTASYPPGKYGDKVRVFHADTAAGTVNPTGYTEYIWANPSSAATGTGGWRQVTVS